MSEAQPEASMVAGLTVTAEATVIRGGRVVGQADHDEPGDEQQEQRP